MKNFEEKTLRSELIFDGKVVHLYRDDIELPDGREAFREYVRHIGAVCVIPVTDKGEVICVKQYRYPLGDVVLEIPAGKLDYKGEDPEGAARRELREETGAISGKLTYLGKFFSSPAILDECIHMYLAEELEFGDTDLDEDEFIEVVKIPIEELAEMVCRGEIIDGKTQAGVMKALYILNKNDSRG
ncbi:MAG: NUDIX hydrolase [Clostridia bacterium]|nr:NUDIX hydrolase [Clostridia bacterium]